MNSMAIDSKQIQKFNEAFDTFASSAVRLETLPYYDIKATGEFESYQKYLRGEVDRSYESDEWLQKIRGWTASGKTIRRFRVLPGESKWDPYLNFEIDTGYPYNVESGEEILFVREEDLEPSDIRRDFWLLDSETAIIMNYEDGRFTGMEFVDKVDDLVEVLRRAEEKAIGFSEYMAIRRKKAGRFI